MDVKRLAMAAETRPTFCRACSGSMMLRPGWKYLGATYTNAAARFLKFIFSTDDTALLELTNLLMRVWIDDALLTRPAVTTTITNGTFNGTWRTGPTTTKRAPPRSGLPAATCS
jgi:hypothetical protein